MRAVLVPGALALLPAYGGLQDPLAELRAACVAAVGWAAADGPVVVLGTEQGCRVGRSLVEQAGFEALPSLPGSRQARPPETARPPAHPLVVVANGSAKRGVGSPGYVDERAVGFDAGLGARLRAGDLAGIDHDLARELWADTAALDELAALLPPGCSGTVDYEDDPYGVQYWVVRWEW